ncbi:alpha/beta hydrolase family protein [Variovorax sp. PAMC26660]|uniref:alpha/beta hydrolase family protein n=1 Tax=Variovorax sp. PAMC26660 TaxID=2762322 RepID=UPI00164D2807|nr:prolyl oligopeptidase family serine peptidase [Variovorax sp. PAMC26660]QNK71368.1 prolyl oligopeptidase family serine peptidase [Variovorax sp. PAMC26660]
MSASGHVRRHARFALLLLALAQTACAQRTGPDVPAPLVASGDAVLHWNQPAVRANCPDRAGYLWVQPVEGPACIRYFASDDIEGARIAIVQFSGDRDSVMDQAPTRIPENTEALRTLDAQRSRDRAGVPWIFVARPGTYGSSGDHRKRRQPVEFHALDAALDALMARHKLQRIVIVGHSGGATAGAALLTMGRTRIACAVLTSGAFGLLERARLLGRSKDGLTDTTGSTQFYDPLDHVGGIARDASRRIVLIGNREDQNTPFALQQRFADAVAKAGHRIEIRTHAAEPPEFHDLTDRIGLRTASLCAREAMFPSQDRP